VDSAHFAVVADLLAGEFRTITYDRRGTGDSPRPPGWHSTSMAEQADDAAGLIEALGLGPCAIWGGSLGGVVLLELLARRPGLVRAAIVHEPPLFGVLDDGAQAAASLLRAAATAVRESTVDKAFAAHASAVLGDAFGRLAPGLRARMAANADVFFDLEVPGLVSAFPGITRVTRVLDRVDVPLTFMADPAAPSTPPLQAATWLAHRAGIRLHELSGGHMPYATEPERTAEAIRTALRDPLEGRKP
jgi:pimeloyl-ACP methyl ester carboxylesterase